MTALVHSDLIVVGQIVKKEVIDSREESVLRLDQGIVGMMKMEIIEWWKILDVDGEILQSRWRIWNVGLVNRAVVMRKEKGKFDFVIHVKYIRLEET